jgi:hypothetical protein
MNNKIDPEKLITCLHFDKVYAMFYCENEILYLKIYKNYPIGNWISEANNENRYVNDFKKNYPEQKFHSIAYLNI